MSTLQQLESLSDALKTIKAARLKVLDVQPVWNILNHAGQHLERQMSTLLAE